MTEGIQNSPLAGCPAGYGSLAKTFPSGGAQASTTDADIEDGDRHAGGSPQLTEEAQRQVQQLKQRDQQVRAHERAHMAAGADLVRGGASFTFEKGPDGRMYAVGGEVKIDTSAENDPDQTIRKMQRVKQAALAPSEPSGTDRAVAAQANQTEARARQEKNRSDKGRSAIEPASGHPDPETLAAASRSNGRRPYSAESLGHWLDTAV